MSNNAAPQQIEARIAASRAELGAILDRIERKLVPTPRQLLHKGVELLMDRGHAEAAGNGEAWRHQSAPLALIGLGLGWLLLSRGDQPLAAQNGEGERAASDDDPPPAPAEGLGDGRERGVLGAAMADHPLALGTLAFLAGAALSMLLPRGAVERAQRLAEQAADAAAALVAKHNGGGET